MTYNNDFYYKDASLIGLIAPRGVGKTLLLTAMAYEELSSAINDGYTDFRIFHNGFLKHSWWNEKIGKAPNGDEYLIKYSLDDIIETVTTRNSKISNGLVLLDEIASVQDNRYGGSYGGILFSHWVIMIRKIGVTILWAGQNEEVDRRLKLQCDIVGYPVVSRRRRGKEVGVTWVYQSGTYAHEGHKRKFFYNKLKNFWNAYDTSEIIQSEQMTKSDINRKMEEEQEREIFDNIYYHLKDKDSKKMNIMEIKKITGVDWQIKKLSEFVTYFGKKSHSNKGNFDFKEIFR